MSNEKKQSTTIEIKKDGPLIVKGLNKWQDSNSEQMPIKDTIALCRCGASRNKPYCDGIHKANGFSGKREINKPIDTERAYPGKDITIHDNRVICSHAAECVDQLSSVFRLKERPWIQPDHADTKNIIEVVNSCPSGALSYTIDDVHHRDLEREASIKISKDGPYNIEGGIRLEVDEELQPPSKEHYSLCRCGASKNKPYCDGAHHDIGFNDENI